MLFTGGASSEADSDRGQTFNWLLASNTSILQILTRTFHRVEKERSDVSYILKQSKKNVTALSFTSFFLDVWI